MIAVLPFVLASAVAVPPCPVPTHDEVRMVFYDFGSADLSLKASEVLKNSVIIALDEKYLREIVTGYCDADESAAGDCPALAQRRADAVKAALVKLGLKAKRIETFTKNDPLNPGDPAENRRVVIDPILPPDDDTCGRR